MFVTSKFRKLRCIGICAHNFRFGRSPCRFDRLSSKLNTAFFLKHLYYNIPRASAEVSLSCSHSACVSFLWSSQDTWITSPHSTKFWSLNGNSITVCCDIPTEVLNTCLMHLVRQRWRWNIIIYNSTSQDDEWFIHLLISGREGNWGAAELNLNSLFLWHL